MEDKPIYFNPIRNRRTFDQISTEIKRMIVEGVFKPGDKLPAESEIARQFGVGRQTVREALRMLELSVFLAVQKGGGGGSIITNTIMDTIKKSFLDALIMKNISVTELTTARVEIEKLVISNATDNATNEDITVLNENITKATAKISQGLPAFEENIGFHSLLARASKNGVFVIVIESIMPIVSDFLSRIPQPLDISKKIYDEHQLMVDAIQKRDKKQATVLMENHLSFVDKRFKSSFEGLIEEKRQTPKKVSRPKAVRNA